MRDRARRDRRPRLPVVDLGRWLQRPVAFPRTGSTRLAAGMTELDSGNRVLLLDEPDQALQRLNEALVPDSEIAHGAAIAALDLGGFDNNEPGAARCELPGIHQ